MKTIILALLAALAISVPMNLYDWTCNSWTIVGTVGQAISPVTCTCNINQDEQSKFSHIGPQLPIGLGFTDTISGSIHTLVISGTPTVAQEMKTYSIGFKEYVSHIRIGVKGVPTYLSYGFDSMSVFVGAPLEPIPSRSDVYLNDWSINPALPSGVSISATTGLISGIFANTESSGRTYTVTATNGLGTITTTVTFTVKDQIEMHENGFIGCYWSGTTECRTPAFDYYYQNSAQYCQKESKFRFYSIEDESPIWPGLDERFRDHYTAYMYGYIDIPYTTSYTFYLNSDDAALLYIDDLDTPLINRDGCRGESIDDQATTILTAGKHLLIVKFVEYNGNTVLTLKYQSYSAGISLRFIDNTITKVGGRGPSFISYPVISGYVNAELKVYTPEMVSGGADQWTVNPPLPSGMSFDPYRGQIRGKPIATYNGQHTVTATGYVGSASTTIQIIISDAPLSGFRGKYYKILDTEMCAYSSLAPSQLELKMTKIESQINFPTTLVGVWPGLPSDLDNYFYIEWEGYLKHDESGNWKIRLGCDDSCRLYSIEDTLRIDHWELVAVSSGALNSCHGFSKKETTVAINSPGYYYYKIRYQQKVGTKGLTLEWQAPSGNWEVIPAEKIFHTAPGVLSYDYEIAHYFKDVAINENVPHLFSIPSCNGYTVTPQLPVGLTLGNNGVISGIPTTVQFLSQYTVTCTSATGPVKTTIQMDIYHVNPPSGLSLYYNGQVVGTTPIQLIPARAISPITVVGGATVTNYVIRPDLPYGLSFNSETGAVSGTPLEPIETKVFTIIASNAGGSVTLVFSMSVSGCKGASWSGEFYIVSMHEGHGIFSIEQNGATAQCSIGNFDDNGNVILSSCSMNVSEGSEGFFCIQSAANLKFKVKCESQEGCYVQARKPNGNRWPVQFIVDPVNDAPYYATWDYPSTLTPLTTLTLSAAETTVFTGFPINPISITPNGCYKTITITPSLDVDNVISLIRPVINAEVHGRYQTIFTVTATGDAGTATAILTVNFRECEDDGKSSSVKFVMKTAHYGGEQSYEVYRESDNVMVYVGKGFGNYNSYTNTVCSITGNYKIVLKDSYGDGWSVGSNLKLYDREGSLLQELRLDTGSRSTHTFTIAPPSTNIVWKRFFNGNPGKNWNQVSFDDSKWQETTDEMEYDNWSQATIYLRYSFSLSESKKYYIAEFGVWYKDGIIIYMNGQEVYRRNLGSSSINHNTFALSSYDYYSTHRGTIPGYYLENDMNTIAMEIHRASSTTDRIQFHAYVNIFGGERISRVYGGSITESSFYNQPSESSAAAWDRDINTKWIENGLPAWTIYSYNSDRMEWINQIIITSADKEEYDPAEFNFYGSTDGVEYVRLLHYNDTEIFESRSQTKGFQIEDHYTAYGHYKFEIVRTRGGGARASLTMIDIQSSRLTGCMEDQGFPRVDAGMTSAVNCETGFIGEMYRTCSLDVLKPYWGAIDKEECRTTNPDKNYGFIDTAIAFHYVTKAQLDAAKNSIKNYIAIIAGVNANEVDPWKVKDVSANYSVVYPTSALYIRFTVEAKVADTVLKAVMNCIASLMEALKKDKVEGFPAEWTINFYMEPQLVVNNEVPEAPAGPNTLVIVLIIVAVVVLVAVGVFFIIRGVSGKKRKNGVKHLERSKEKESV